MFDTQEFQPISEDKPSLSEAIREPLREPINEVREPISEVRESTDIVDSFANSPKSSKELASYFGVTKESIQDWYKIITDAYFWLPKTDFKTGSGKNTRYTILAITLMIELKAARADGRTADEWIASVRAKNADKIETILEPEVVDVPKSSGLAVYAPETTENTDSIIGGLTIVTKSSEHREVLKAELVLQSEDNEQSWDDFSQMMAELETESLAADEEDELEFQLLRKQNAKKWLNRKAILEQDKQRILQGKVAKNGKAPKG